MPGNYSEIKTFDKEFMFKYRFSFNNYNICPLSFINASLENVFTFIKLISTPLFILISVFLVFY